ncbi:hypothetical protein BS50DRAFT_368235 [Corynespora cassiicola Philippines]|uniref:Uncharacterized protein n=1 Tax=Corynespora cassiicola Philippines TaxID=1448308 RepID=A0A2T2MZY9_CORCC|nr:hypothetical protein BS50DRAFT_395719 [Corynespora cassiicola Philippines]PSN58761.1 hypothetical protein BS50DRAFT_368235 [Corynespora cassiicola Philippines]
MGGRGESNKGSSSRYLASVKATVSPLYAISKRIVALSKMTWRSKIAVRYFCLSCRSVKTGSSSNLVRSIRQSTEQNSLMTGKSKLA